MKKGFIFSFDSFLALIMFTLFTILIYLFFIFYSPTLQQYYFAEDMLNVLDNVKINELDLSYYPLINNMINDGTIKDPSASIIEQIIILESENKRSAACLIFKDISEKALPSSYKTGLDLTTVNICGEERKATNIISRGRTSTGKIGV